VSVVVNITTWFVINMQGGDTIITDISASIAPVAGVLLSYPTDGAVLSALNPNEVNFVAVQADIALPGDYATTLTVTYTKGGSTLTIQQNLDFHGVVNMMQVLINSFSIPSNQWTTVSVPFQVGAPLTQDLQVFLEIVPANFNITTTAAGTGGKDSWFFLLNVNPSPKVALGVYTMNVRVKFTTMYGDNLIELPLLITVTGAKATTTGLESSSGTYVGPTSGTGVVSGTGSGGQENIAQGSASKGTPRYVIGLGVGLGVGLVAVIGLIILAIVIIHKRRANQMVYVFHYNPQHNEF